MPGGGPHRFDPAPPSQPSRPASGPGPAGRQASHRLASPPRRTLQNGVATGQSAEARHSTHAFLIVSQTGAPPSLEHCASVVHPGVQRFARQTGPAAEVAQSVSAMHSTQRFVAVSHSGAPASAPPQSAPVTHCTHCWVVISHTGRRSGPPASGMQSADVEQPTHAPVATSHLFVAPPHIGPPSVAHDAWQIWVLGQQTGVEDPAQSALVAQTTQVPLRQTFIPLGHWAFVRHSTQPAGTPGPPVQRLPPSCPPLLPPPS